jgi:hypothetical protein
MDEMKLVRDLRPEPTGPSIRTLTQAESRLSAEFAADNSRSWHGLRPIGFKVVLPVLAAGTAAAAAIAILVPGHLNKSSETTSTTHSPGSTVALSAENVLLAAAHQAETTPRSGTYWHVKVMYTIPTRVGTGHPYWMGQMQINETWTTPTGRAWSGFRVAGARPLTATDASAWRNDGSPTTWDLGPGDTTDHKHVYLSTRPQHGFVVADDTPGTFQLADQQLTFKQLQALPTTAATLSAWISKSPTIAKRNAGARVPLSTDEGFVAQWLSALLADLPAPPQVRAAAYRALAAMPNVRVHPIKDGQGRPGIDVSIADTAPGSATIRLIIDPKTSLILFRGVTLTGSNKRFKSKNIDATYLQTGWTDQKPQVPSVP